MLFSATNKTWPSLISTCKVHMHRPDTHNCYQCCLACSIATCRAKLQQELKTAVSVPRTHCNEMLNADRKYTIPEVPSTTKKAQQNVKPQKHHRIEINRQPHKAPGTKGGHTVSGQAPTSAMAYFWNTTLSPLLKLIFTSSPTATT